jgi:RND superfamily putative drug exporter
VALIGLGLIATGIKPGISDVDTLASKGEAKDGLIALEQSGIGSGALIPHEVLVHGGNPDTVATAAAGVAGIRGTVAPSDPSWRNGDAAVVDAFPEVDATADRAGDIADDLRVAVHATGDSRLGGQVAENSDFVDAVYGLFPLMIVLIALVTFVLLARAFRSLLLPAKAVILNVISVGAAWGGDDPGLAAGPLAPTRSSASRPRATSRRGSR